MITDLFYEYDFVDLIFLCVPGSDEVLSSRNVMWTRRFLPSWCYCQIEWKNLPSTCNNIYSFSIIISGSSCCSNLFLPVKVKEWSITSAPRSSPLRVLHISWFRVNSFFYLIIFCPQSSYCTSPVILLFSSSWKEETFSYFIPHQAWKSSLSILFSCCWPVQVFQLFQLFCFSFLFTVVFYFILPAWKFV